MSIPLTQSWSANTWDWPLQKDDGEVRVQNTTQGFEVELNCQDFKPEEIEIKVADNELLIVCSHDGRSDGHGTVARRIQRAYKLPDDVDESTITKALTAKGHVLITAAKKE